MHVSLRPLVDADLDAIYEQMKDPESVRMAAFTPDTRPWGSDHAEAGIDGQPLTRRTRFTEDLSDI
jgi:hypothetical protein